MWRCQFIRWCPDTPWYNKYGEGNEKCWGSDWVLMEDNLVPGPKHAFWKMLKGSILYVGGNKPGPFSKGWMGQVVQVIHRKSGGSTDGTQTVMLLRRMEE